jgi:excisionase family DNA binding protein
MYEQKGGSPMLRMRYPKQALDLIREEDPGTQLTVNFIRQLAYSGRIPSVKVGRRHLIDVDALYEYLKNPNVYEEVLPVGIVRKIRL